jgi:hypothetical protein
MRTIRRIPFLLTVLLLALAACNFPSASQANNPSENPTNQQNSAGDNQNEDNTPELSPTETKTQPPPEPAALQLPAFNPAEPCSIVTPEAAEQVLGQAVAPVEGPGTCLYSTGTVSITVGVLEGEAARLALASQILQLEDDCTMSFAYSADQPDPTPLPPEADPLLAMSMAELLEQSLTLQQSCGGAEFEILSEYGPGVYILPFELFMPGGLVSIAAEDYTLTILYTDIDQDAAASVEAARQLLELLAAGK